MPACPGQDAAGQRAEQDGDEGAALDQRIAADEFVLAQVLRQDGVLDWPEERRVQAEQEQRAQENVQAVQVKAERSDAHDRHFQHFHDPGQRRLVVLVGQLPGRCREEEEGEDEDPRREVGEQLGRKPCPARRLKGQQDDERVLEQVVVEGPEELGNEEGRETPRPEQGELRAVGILCGRDGVRTHADGRDAEERMNDGGRLHAFYTRSIPAPGRALACTARFRRLQPEV